MNLYLLAYKFYYRTKLNFLYMLYSMTPGLRMIVAGMIGFMIVAGFLCMFAVLQNVFIKPELK